MRSLSSTRQGAASSYGRKTKADAQALPELVTTGPYRRIRHPIYSGIILAMVGTAVAVSWYWLVAVALLGGYFVYLQLLRPGCLTDCPGPAGSGATISRRVPGHYRK